MNRLDYELFKRDRGVCFYCKADLHLLQLTLDKYFHECCNKYGYREEEARMLTRRFARAWAPERATVWPKRLWERHHVIARAEGGADTLENCVTACARPCHKRESRKLAGRQAIRRKRHTYIPHIPEELR